MAKDKNISLLDIVQKLLEEMGFVSIILDTDYCIRNKNFKKELIINKHPQDLDIFAFEGNGKLVLLIECSTTSQKKTNEKRLANDRLEAIENNLPSVIGFLRDNQLISEDHIKNLLKYVNNSNPFLKTVIRKLFLNLNDDFTENRYDNTYLIDSKRFIYFYEIVELLGEFAKYEFYSYLSIVPKDMALNIDDFERWAQPFNNPALSVSVGPLANTQMYVFKLSPAYLLKFVKVIRNKQWEEKAYQRSLYQKKLKSIQEYVVSKKNRFPNNIIVTLPKSANFVPSDKEGFGYLSFEQNFNSLCLIDGQHRLFAFAKLLNKKIDNMEFQRIKEEYQLIVTGVKFNEGSDTTKEEATLFSDINTTQLKVNQSLLDTIFVTVNPQHKRAISKLLIVQMNGDGFFKDKFKLFILEDKVLKKYKDIIDISKYKSEINTNTIIGSALVQIVQPKGRLNKKFSDLQKNTTPYDFVKYVSEKISNFFELVNNNYKSKNDNLDIRDSSFFNTFGIVAFLKLFHSFCQNSVNDKDFKPLISMISFTMHPQYVSSQWNIFVKDMQNEMGDLLKSKYPDFKYVRLKKSS